MKREARDEFQYDAFISYSPRDPSWVQRELLPELEQPGLRTTDLRDFEPGVPKLVNRENAVVRSRKTVIVLTPAWVEEEWTSFDGILVQADDPIGRQRRMIPLLLQPCTLPPWLAMLTVLDFTQAHRRQSQLARLIAAIKAVPEAVGTTDAYHQECQKRYLGWLARTCGRVVLLGIRSTDQPYIELNLDDIYVPLEAMEILSEQERWPVRSGKGAKKSEDIAPATRLINLKDLLKVGKRIVVVGGPGSGKSTVLQYIAWTLAESLTNNKPELARERLGLSGPLPIPILVPLHAFAEHRSRCYQDPDPELSTLAACVFDYLTRATAAPDLSLEFFKSLLAEDGACLVMLDGLDEVASEAERELVCRAIEHLADWTPDNRYIVTSRPEAYTGQAVIAGNFRQVRVKPLERADGHDEVRPLVEKLYQAAGHAERVEPLMTWLDELETQYDTLNGRVLSDSGLLIAHSWYAWSPLSISAGKNCQNEGLNCTSALWMLCCVLPTIQTR